MHGHAHKPSAKVVLGLGYLIIQPKPLLRLVRLCKTKGKPVGFLTHPPPWKPLTRQDQLISVNHNRVIIQSQA